MAYDFAVGQTNPETFPVEALKAAAMRAIDREHDSFNRYPGAYGHEGLRRLMAERESDREGVSVDPDQIVLTNGSMQAVTLAGQALMEKPGDKVICEEFTYSGTISAYSGIGLDLEGIPLDEDGMRIDALRDRLARLADAEELPKFIYTLTTYQNPTGTVMPEKRKRELIEVAAQYDLPVVEDNCYGDVHFEGEKVPSIYAMDDSPNQIYICSLSKILGPGLRLGYLLAREPMLSHIAGQRFDAGSNTFAAAIAAEFYSGGVWDHCETANPVLRRKRDLVCGGLAAHADDLCVWSNPVGGLFVWVRLPDDVDIDRLTGIANDREVFFAPGSSFHVKRETVPYIRLAFGHVPDADIIEGIPRLAQSIREARTSNEARAFTTLFD